MSDIDRISIIAAHLVQAAESTIDQFIADSDQHTKNIIIRIKDMRFLKDQWFAEVRLINDNEHKTAVSSTTLTKKSFVTYNSMIEIVYDLKFMIKKFLYNLPIPANASTLAKSQQFFKDIHNKKAVLDQATALISALITMDAIIKDIENFISGQPFNDHLKQSVYLDYDKNKQILISIQKWAKSH